MNGFVLIDKESGRSSFRVCAELRKVLHVKKVGHTGTLDPFATGLLIVAMGRCTKLIPLLEDARKTYRATILFGKTSETLDPESEILDAPMQGPLPSRESLERALRERFAGRFLQSPPQFSALKIGGRKMYQLARAGKQMDIPPREVEVFSSRILSYEFPNLEVELEVAAGFYVRSFARDIGQAFGGGGICSQLRRTAVGDISVTSALKIAEVKSALDPRRVLTSLPQIVISEEAVPAFIARRDLALPGMANRSNVLVLCRDQTLGTGEIRDGWLKPSIVLGI